MSRATAQFDGERILHAIFISDRQSSAMTIRIASVACACGQTLAVPDETAGREETNLLCSCGRRLELRREKGAWAIAASLTPERSVPISGFSREIREDPEAQRFFFSHSIGGAPMPVHIVYLASSRAAEVKAAGMKVTRFSEVDGPLEARSRWVARFDSLRRSSSVRPVRGARGAEEASP
jgi:hypothetical protein